MTNLEQAESFFKTADHLAYVTYPLMKDGTLLRKILDNLKNSTEKIMQNVCGHKILDKDLIRKYFQGILNENEILIFCKMLDNFEKKEKSTFEFLRKEKLVLMNDDLNVSSVTLDELRQYLHLIKKIILNLKIHEKNR